MVDFDQPLFDRIFERPDIGTVYCHGSDSRIVYTRRHGERVSLQRTDPSCGDSEAIVSELPKECSIAYDAPSESVLVFDQADDRLRKLHRGDVVWAVTDLGVDDARGSVIGELDGRVYLLAVAEDCSRVLAVRPGEPPRTVYWTPNRIGDHHGQILYRNGSTTVGSFATPVPEANALLFVEIDERQLESRLLLYDVDSGETSRILSTGDCYYHVPHVDVANDGSGVYVSHLGDGQVVLSRLCLDDGTTEPVVENGDVVSFRVAAEDRVAYALKRPANPDIALMTTSVDGGSTVVRSDGVNHPVGHTDDRLVFRSSGFHRPPGYLAFDRDAAQLTEFADSVDAGTDDSSSHVEVVHSPADERLYGFLYRPESLPPDSAAPLVVWVHGGPSERHVAEYNPIFNWLVSNDVLVFAPTYPGTTGQGLDFFERAKQSELGVADVDGLVSLVEHVATRVAVDEDRMTVAGASYGGYLALQLLVRTNLFASGIACSGIADWEYQYENTRKQRYDHWLLFGDGEYDADRLREKSPIHEFDSVDVPLYLTHGKEDTSVPFGQIRALAFTCPDRVPVQTCFSDEGSHGLGSFPEADRLRWGQLFAEFLQP